MQYSTQARIYLRSRSRWFSNYAKNTHSATRVAESTAQLEFCNGSGLGAIRQPKPGPNSRCVLAFLAWPRTLSAGKRRLRRRTAGVREERQSSNLAVGLPEPRRHFARASRQ